MMVVLAAFIGCTKDEVPAPALPSTTTSSSNNNSNTGSTNTGNTGTSNTNTGTSGTTNTNTGTTGTTGTTGNTNTNTGNTNTTGTNTGGTNTGSTGTTTPPSTSGTSTLNEATMLQLVNAARTKGCNCGSTYMQPVSPVTWNDKLEQAALNHSIDMTTNNFFSHTGSNGSTPATRITAAGYQWSAIGENIAMGYPDEKAVVDGWLSSEGHCKNIMNGGFTEMGVARDGKYWTQEFGKPMK